MFMGIGGVLMKLKYGIKEWNKELRDMLLRRPTEEEMKDPDFHKKVNDFYEECKKDGRVRE